jgi:phosphatidylserine/phosphatidylglycerophosphate/cardiolipin synthase-like enzyme
MTLSLKLAAVLANVVLVGALAGVPAGASARSHSLTAEPTGFEPVAGAVFNDPTGTPEEQFRIVDHVVQLIDNSPTGSFIRLATMTVNARTVDALISARQRGVNVRVILPNQMIGKPSPSRLTAETGTNTRAGSYVFYCRNACYRDGSSGVHHNKLFLFSQVGTTPNVVSTSSGNLDNYMAERRYNDAYTMVDDAEGYQAGVAYFDQMLSDSYHNAAAPTATGNGVTYHFFPRRRANLFGSIMNKVRCQGATGGTGIDGRTAIRMTTSLWDRSRLDVARQVVGLRRHGCNIYVIAQSYNIDRGILRMFRAAKVRFRFADTPRTALGNHSKYVTVSGNFNGRTNSTTVYSGSLNLTASDNSACDNNMIRITDVSAHTAYREHFAALWAKSAPVTNAQVEDARTFVAGPETVAKDDGR